MLVVIIIVLAVAVALVAANRLLYPPRELCALPDR